VGYDFDNEDGDGNKWTGWALSVAYDFWHATNDWWGSDGTTQSTEDVSWWGHCTDASAAIVCEDEPSGNYSEGGVTFTPADKKGLLVALYHKGLVNRKGPDVTAADWHAAVEGWAVDSGKMFYGDKLNTGMGWDIIWNYPVCQAELEYKEEPEQDEPTDPKILRIYCDVHYWISSGDGQSAREQEESYEYTVAYNTAGHVDTDSPENTWQTAETERPETAVLPSRATTVNDDWWDNEFSYSDLAEIIPLD